MSLAYAPLTGRPGILRWYDWIRHCYRIAPAISLCKPEPIDAAPDALTPEPWQERRKPLEQKYKTGELHGALILCLVNHGLLTTQDLAEMLGTSYQSVYKTLDKRPDTFERVRGGQLLRWRLIDGRKE